MRRDLIRRYWLPVLAAAVMAGLVATFAPAPQPPEAPASDVRPPRLPTPAPVVAVVEAAALEATSEPTPEPPPPTETPVPPTPTPDRNATPTPRPAGTPIRVGLQVGHWKSNELPDELSRLRGSTGAFAAGHSEASVNLDIAQRVAKLLEKNGIVVDVLPATIPPSYDADAFVSIHADGSQSARARGFKLATPWRASGASQHLLEAITAEYASATGMPKDDAITFNMRGYYAFSYRRHTHAVARTTPAVILEMGFLTSSVDRAIMIGQPDRVAVGIANGIIRYLNERDPNDGAALLPPEFQSQHAIAPEVIVRSAPDDQAGVRARVTPDVRLMPIRERDGWYEVVVGRGWRVTGWVRKDQVQPSGDPLPTPPPATDS